MPNKFAAGIRVDCIVADPICVCVCACKDENKVKWKKKLMEIKRDAY